jgi:hypothetical protein
VKLFRPCDQSSNDTALEAFFEPIKGPCRRTPLAGRAGGFFGPERLLNQGPRSKPSKVKVKSKSKFKSKPKPKTKFRGRVTFRSENSTSQESQSQSQSQTSDRTASARNKRHGTHATSRNALVTDMTTVPISVVNCSIADKLNRFKILSAISNHTHC